MKLQFFIKAQTVTGDGSSLWMESSKVKATVTSFVVHFWPSEGEKGYDLEFEGAHEVVVSGENLPWEAYTDKKIEKQIRSIVAPYLAEQGYKIVSFGWSEQGMQDDNAWSFDIKTKWSERRFADETWNRTKKGLDEASKRVSGYSVEQRAELTRSAISDRRK